MRRAQRGRLRPGGDSCGLPADTRAPSSPTPSRGFLVSHTRTSGSLHPSRPALSALPPGRVAVVTRACARVDGCVSPFPAEPGSEPRGLSRPLFPVLSASRSRVPVVTRRWRQRPPRSKAPGQGGAGNEPRRFHSEGEIHSDPRGEEDSGVSVRRCA